MMDMMNGARRSLSFFTKSVGIGSRSQLLLGDSLMSFLICSIVTDSNDVKELLMEDVANTKFWAPIEVSQTIESLIFLIF